MKYACILLAFLILLSGCAPSQPAPETEPTVLTTAMEETEGSEPSAVAEADPMEELFARMTVEEKVGQLFLARCPETQAQEDISTYHLGGYILYGRDIAGQTPDTLLAAITRYQLASPIPLLITVDEEGGTVCRVSSNSAFRDTPFSSPRTLYASGGMELVLSTEAEKEALLRSLGFNVNMAPVCDVTTDPGAFMYARSLGQSPEITAEFSAGTVAVMAEHQVGSVLKHFPGYGNNTDTHTSIAVDSRSLEELESADLLPFQAGIDAGCGAVLVSHTIVNCLDDALPASLSPAVHTYLRESMGFDGVIMTDDLYMDAITDAYGAGEAAVLAVLAGNDLLCSTEYAVQYQAVLEAVETGRIPMELLDAAVWRVLQWKHELGLLF